MSFETSGSTKDGEEGFLEVRKAEQLNEERLGVSPTTDASKPAANSRVIHRSSPGTLRWKDKQIHFCRISNKDTYL
jgi:hypothetical protein